MAIRGSGTSTSFDDASELYGFISGICVSYSHGVVYFMPLWSLLVVSWVGESIELHNTNSAKVA